MAYGGVVEQGVNTGYFRSRMERFVTTWTPSEGRPPAAGAVTRLPLTETEFRNRVMRLGEFQHVFLGLIGMTHISSTVIFYPSGGDTTEQSRHLLITSVLTTGGDFEVAPFVGPSWDDASFIVHLDRWLGTGVYVFNGPLDGYQLDISGYGLVLDTAYGMLKANADEVMRHLKVTERIIGGDA